MAEELGLAGEQAFLESDSEAEGDTDHDTDSEDDDMGVGPGPEPIWQGVIRQRLLGWPDNRLRQIMDSNDSLINHLKKTSAVSVPQIVAAMRTCHRDQFVPGGIQENENAFQDAPIHISGYGFNISAPHMHAACLQALDLKPGHRVLDVGSGSGLLTAYAAMVVGKSGHLLGIDCSAAATKLAKRNIKRQLRTNPAFAEKSAPCTFWTHNVFMPAENFKGQFDRIVVGASSPQKKVDWLVSLLKPEGGVLVTPVVPSQLCRITKLPGGHTTTSVISHVRFSNLEIPREICVLKALLDLDRQASLKPPEPLSTFASDIASIHGSAMSPMASTSLGSEQSVLRHGILDTPTSSSWPRRVTKLFTACSTGSASEHESQDEMVTDVDDSPKAAALLDPHELGTYDCEFLGSEWTLPAHKEVLKTRSDLLRAQFTSGMRDAEAVELNVPEAFTKEAMEAFMKYCYTDKLDGCTSAEFAAQCLSVAIYYGEIQEQATTLLLGRDFVAA